MRNQNIYLPPVLSKDIIKQQILPHLSQGKRGTKCKTDHYQIVKAIFHKLKTGSQWRELPMYEFFRSTTYSWQSVYYHFSKWAKDGSWQRLWIALLKKISCLFRSVLCSIRW